MIKLCANPLFPPLPMFSVSMNLVSYSFVSLWTFSLSAGIRSLETLSAEAMRPQSRNSTLHGKSIIWTNSLDFMDGQRAWPGKWHFFQDSRWDNVSTIKFSASISCCSNAVHWLNMDGHNCDCFRPYWSIVEGKRNMGQTNWRDGVSLPTTILTCTLKCCNLMGQDTLGCLHMACLVQYENYSQML